MILRVAGIDQLVAGAPVPPVKVFNIEAQCNATTDNFRGAGTRKCRRPRKARLCDDRHIVLALFADKPVIIILGKFACSEEMEEVMRRAIKITIAIAMMSLLALAFWQVNAMAARQKPVYGIPSNSYLPIQGLQPVY